MCDLKKKKVQLNVKICERKTTKPVRKIQNLYLRRWGLFNIVLIQDSLHISHKITAGGAR